MPQRPGKEGKALKRACFGGVAWLLFMLPVLAQQPLSPLWTHPAHVGFVGAVAFSPDGRYFASGLGDLESGMTASVLHLWDGVQGSYVRTLSPEYYDIQVIRFSPDGSLLIAGGVQTRAFVRDVQSDRTLISYAQYPSDIAISQDGRTVVFAERGKVTVWQGIRQVVWSTAPVHYGILRAALSPDAQRLATVSVPYRLFGDFPGKKVALWNVQDGSLLWTQELPAITASVTMSPDGTHIAVGREDGAVSVLDADTGELLTHLGGLGYDALVQYSPDGSFLVAAGGLAPYLSQGSLRIWRTSDYALLGEIALPGIPSVVAIAPSQTVVAVGYRNGEVEWISLPDGSTRQRLAYTRMAYPYTYEPAKAIRFSPDSRYFAESRVSGVFVADVQRGREVSALRYAPCIISPDLRWVAHLEDTQLTIRRLSDGAAMLHFEQAPGSDILVIFSEDGRYLAVVIYDSRRRPRLQLYTTGSWYRLWEVTLPVYLVVREGCFSPRSTYLALHGYAAVVLRTSDGSTVLDLQDRLDYPFVDAAAFSPDERRFAAANELYVHVYNLPDGSHVWTTPTVSDPQEVWKLRFSPDGRNLLWLQPGSFIVWSTDTWSRRLEAGAYDAEFTPDGRALVLAGRSLRGYDAIRIVRLSDMRVVGSVQDRARRVWVSPDSRYILYLRGGDALCAVRNPLVPVAVPRPPRR